MNIKWNLLSKYKSELYGISILWIILFHGLEMKRTALPSIFSVFDGIIKHGNCGVDIFLFLSGLCLYYSMKNEPNVWKFYIKRAIRIFIPFFILDGIYWFYLLIIKDGNILNFIKNITFYSFWIDGNRYVWFIALIVILYMIYPMLFNIILNNERINQLYYCIIICLLVYLFCYIFRLIDPSWYKEIEIALTRIPVFLIGSYCGRLSYEKLLISTKIKLLSLIIAIMGIGYFYMHPISLVKTFRIPYLFIGPCIAIWLCIIIDSIDSSKFNNILCKLGNLSLELYLSHGILRTLYSKSFLYGKSSVANFNKYIVFVLAGSIFVSILVKYIQKKKIYISTNLRA